VLDAKRQRISGRPDRGGEPGSTAAAERERRRNPRIWIGHGAGGVFDIIVALTTKGQFDPCGFNSSRGSSRSRAGRQSGAEERAVDPRRPRQWCRADVNARDQSVAAR
jgi:hypothetical protein